MNRYQITKDLLALADSSPLNNVDITSIVEKYTNGEELETQKKVRTTIMDILRELKKSEDIEYYEGNFNITVSTGGKFWSNGGPIRSTHKRQKEIEEKKHTKPSSVYIEGDVIASVVGSQDLERVQISPKIKTTQNVLGKKKNKRSALEKLGWVAGIIATILAVWEFILKRFFHQP